MHEPKAPVTVEVTSTVTPSRPACHPKASHTSPTPAVWRAGGHYSCFSKGWSGDPDPQSTKCPFRSGREEAGAVSTFSHRSSLKLLEAEGKQMTSLCQQWPALAASSTCPAHTQRPG